MKQISMTAQEAVTLVRKVVDEAGEDYIYPRAVAAGQVGTGCRYFEDDGTPSCGVGRALAKKGVTRGDLILEPEDIGDWAFIDPDFNTGVGVRELVQHGLLMVDSQTMQFLDEFQGAQDTGSPYGVAFRRALSKSGLDRLVEL